jgi:hypothetical protein
MTNYFKLKQKQGISKSISDILTESGSQPSPDKHILPWSQNSHAREGWSPTTDQI